MGILAALLLAALARSPQDCTLRVLGTDGQPAAGVQVVAQLGLAHLVLAPDFERWVGVRKLEALTDGEGRARFAGLPSGARLTAFARQGQAAGLVEGSAGAELALVLQPCSALSGKVTRKKSLQGYSVVLVGPRGFERKELALDDGEWSATDLAPGEYTLEVRYANWLAARENLVVAPGKAGARKPAKGPTLKLGDEFLWGADPLVEAHLLRLVRADRKALVGVKMAWSAPHMDGWMPSDEDGEIVMAGGDVMIGPPPFVLRLASLGIDQERKYLGSLLEVARGTAVVQVVAELEPLEVRVSRAGAPLADFALYALGPFDPPRVWSARREGAVARLLVPPGELELVALTAEGQRHGERLVLASGVRTHEMVLAGD